MGYKRSNEYQEADDLLTEKIRRPRNTVAIETDPSKKFQLEKQLEEAEKSGKEYA